MTPKEGWLTLDDKGVQMPWYTRSCLEWLDGLDLVGKRVFEYGMGYSSLWYKYKGAIVNGVDSNAEWAKLGGGLYTEDKHFYLNCICGFYDIVVIDGLFRDDCFTIAKSHVNKGGFVIIDNYKQPSVEPDWPLTELELTHLDVTLYKQDGHYDWQTAVIQL